ncbi:ABC transporter ATP-binding protein [Amycolatopsis sp. cg5]|uniref:ABC transporter ATP-binding protein n=1 Tax=Amycolatopsis sp. cg5 TaxID=3238802 RepID=UPI0035251151
MELGLHDVTVTVAGRKLVEALTMTVPSGTVVGLLGPNGSGKSTTLRCVYRALKPSDGVIRLDGRALDEYPLRESARRMAALTQESHTEFDFTVAEVVAMGRLPHDGSDGDICAEALRQVGLSALAGRSVLTLSGGERQRVLLARALAQQPRVLVLDEPTNHLDIRHQLDALALVRKLGVTVLTALHDLNLAAAYCDEVYILEAGRVVAGGPPAAVLTPSLVASVFGVIAHVVHHPVTGVPQLLFEGTTDA